MICCMSAGITVFVTDPSGAAIAERENVPNTNARMLRFITLPLLTFKIMNAVFIIIDTKT